MTVAAKSVSPGPTIHLIGGCNGAGKTTFAMEFLPKEVHCLQFLNADLIASGLSPLWPQAGAVRAARILLQELHGCIGHKQTFGLESTLSGLTYVPLLRHAKTAGYRICLYHLWLPDVQIAIGRVRERVLKGGHGVPQDDIKRRFRRGLANLPAHYLPLADDWSIFDNSGSSPSLVARSRDGVLTVVAPQVYHSIVGFSKSA